MGPARSFETLFGHYSSSVTQLSFCHSLMVMQARFGRIFWLMTGLSMLSTDYGIGDVVSRLALGKLVTIVLPTIVFV